jgi:adenine C2-methylase RlmN of 23S rRNA A2503 and tRNA A37
MLYSETKTTTMEKYLDNSKWNDINTTFLPLADVKASIKLTDGNIIEASGFKLEKRGKTEFHACVSTQVGCKFGVKCVFQVKTDGRETLAWLRYSTK